MVRVRVHVCTHAHTCCIWKSLPNRIRGGLWKVISRFLSTPFSLLSRAFAARGIFEEPVRTGGSSDFPKFQTGGGRWLFLARSPRGERRAVCGVGTVVRTMHTQVIATMVLLQLRLSPAVREGCRRDTSTPLGVRDAAACDSSGANVLPLKKNWRT